MQLGNEGNFAQVAVLSLLGLLVFKIRRHTSDIADVTRVPQWLHNGLLAVLLILIGYAYFDGVFGAVVNSVWNTIGGWIGGKIPGFNDWSLLPKWTIDEIVLVGLPVLY